MTFATTDNLGNSAGRITRGKSSPVEIVSVDADRLDKDETFRNAYAFYIKLSAEPDYFWQSQLAKWDSALSSMSRGLSVEKDRLRAVFVYGDSVQLCTDYAASLVNWVNKKVAEHNERIASLEEAERRQKQMDLTKEESILRELQKVRTEPAVSTSEMTISRLTAAYESGGPEYEGYRDTVMKIRGFVNRIERNYVVLADKYKSPKNVLCVFDKGRTHELKKLKTGQMITIAGEFEGSVLQPSMRHCSLAT